MILDPYDVAVFSAAPETQIATLVEEANSQAVVAAPCLSSATDPDVLNVARGILRDVVLRRLDAGAGSLSGTSQTAGPFSVSQTVDTRQERRALLWPSEITALQALCADNAPRVRMGWLL